jgi:phosphate starvation-inducible membrane PsiE
MVGAIAIIFLLLPESPWWLVSKGKIDKAANVLTFCNGKVEGYDVQEQLVRLFLYTLFGASILTPSRKS